MSNEKENEEKTSKTRPERRWYEARPTFAELYRRYNQPDNIYTTAKNPPDFGEDINEPFGLNSPLSSESSLRMQQIKNDLERAMSAGPITEYEIPTERLKLSIPAIKKRLFSRLPKASESPSETFGQDIMRPPLYEEQERIFNSPMPSPDGSFMPYQGESPVQHPDTVSSFFDGVKNFVNRMNHANRYSLGQKISNYFGEDNMPEAMGELIMKSAEEGKSLYDLSTDDMIKMVGRLVSEKKRINRGETDSENQPGESAESRLASIDNQINALNILLKAKRTYATPEKYEDYIRSIYRDGGYGMKLRSDANTAREQMPVTKGWATAGDIASSMAQGTIPLAVNLFSPLLAPATLIADLSLSASTGMAEASMNVDAYEKATGQKISDLNRNLYVYGTGVTNFVLDVLMQGYFFRNASMHNILDFRKRLKGEVLANEKTFNEVKNLIEKSVANRKSRLFNSGKNVLKASAYQSGTEATRSVLGDVYTTLYLNPEDYPTLTSIIRNSAISAGIGAVAGGVSDVLSRRAESLFGPLRSVGKGRITYIKDKNGYIYQYVDTDPNSGYYRVRDLKGNFRLFNPEETFTATTFNYKDYIAAEREWNKTPYHYPVSYPKDKISQRTPKLEPDFGNNKPFKGKLTGADNAKPGTEADAQPKEITRESLKYNRVYKMPEEIDDVIDRGLLGKIFVDKSTGEFIDTEEKAPFVFPLKGFEEYRTGRQGTQSTEYPGAPFLTGDELVWRMFNPEDADVWLKNNPFFDSRNVNHNFAREVPEESLYRPFYYRDKSISDEEFGRRLLEIIGKDGDKNSGPGNDRNRGNGNFEDDEEDIYGNLAAIFNSEKIDPEFDNLHIESFLANADKNSINDNEGAPFMLHVDGEEKLPVYRDEMGRIFPIPYVISPYEDLLLQAKEMSNRLHIKTVLYKKQSDIPEKLRRRLGLDSPVSSFYDASNNEVGIVLENSSIRDVQIAMLKFGIIKRGLKSILGDKTDKYLRSVYKKIPKEYKKYYYEEYPSIQEGATAYLVDVATNPKLDDSQWNTFSAIVRRFLKNRFGIGEIEDVDLRYILWQAVNRIKEDDSIKEMQRKSRAMRGMSNKHKGSSSGDNAKKGGK